MNETLKDLNCPGISQEEGKIFQQVYEKELGNITMHPEVTKLLDTLQEREIPMGIITNGPINHQFRKVKRLNPGKWVPSQNIIISQGMDFQKPEKEIFDLACDQFCMEPEHILYVGDSYDNDIIGARNSGWHSPWLNHCSRELSSCQPASHLAEVTCFTKLCSIVEKLFNL